MVSLSAVPDYESSIVSSVVGKVFYGAESIVNWAMGKSRSRESNPYLAGNYSPVEQERFDEELLVEGELPADLSGCFLRIGSNPKMRPMGGYHWFDGDGMVHACRVKNGRVFYANRWVKTARFKKEQAVGWDTHLKIGDMVGAGGLLALAFSKLKGLAGLTVGGEGRGTANTAMVFHAGRLLALHEGDMPYALRVACEGIVETAGRLVYQGQRSFTAHPKVDPATGDMHFFGYSVESAPYCTYGVAGPDGALKKQIPITVPKPVMMHDFAVTEAHAIFIDTPLVFDPSVMVREGTLPFAFDEGHGIRFGLRRHDAPEGEEAVQWFSSPPCMIFHVANAWDDGEKVHLVACAMRTLDLSVLSTKRAMTEDMKPFLTRFVFDTRTGETVVTRLSDCAAEFPQIKQSLVGRKCRYAFAARYHESPKGDAGFDGICKFDLDASGPRDGHDACSGAICFGEGRYGGEAIFVPKGSPKSEDDGYLLTYVYDEGRNKSDFVVFDAKTMSSEPIAKVQLPCRVPYGFHGLFMDEDDMKKQAGQS
uniref:carotenoid 9,10-dioxygenase n=1 Tax=Tetraselmis sp. GSL018 TaxID=582737 RepID=A0A061RE98_9CHLO|eukprot:CAMPEP_0177585416 /NCGR_PEP_ID=MMETSP0419_2-20121207/4482_1 /TAXON_ID=582737 /ORGANISM="Tetraselmis sp., Strain GSL018" /LENGTH=535 /DNA_ID=CAMNT_0019075149 /DNA_START=139 /DNA_END=1746 /DNA_ORIENTATION=+